MYLILLLISSILEITAAYLDNCCITFSTGSPGIDHTAVSPAVTLFGNGIDGQPGIVNIGFLLSNSLNSSLMSVSFLFSYRMCF